MAQLSRPYQILLGAVLVFGLIWAVALRGHGSNPSEPVPTAPKGGVPVTSASSEAKAAAAPTPIYHGAATGVEGLTRAIAKAHEAVATSQKNAQQLQRKSGEASQESQASTATTATPSSAATQISSKSATAATNRAAHVQNTAPGSSSKAKGHSAVDPEQLAVEHELSQGKTVMLVFWNPKSTVDNEVQAQAKILAARSKGTITLHDARANQVGKFGTITEVAHIYQTPTILIVNKQGVVSTLTGLTDVFALEQAVREARNASK